MPVVLKGRMHKPVPTFKTEHMLLNEHQYVEGVQNNKNVNWLK